MSRDLKTTKNDVCCTRWSRKAIMLLAGAALAGGLHVWTLCNAMDEPVPNPEITVNGNDIEYEHRAEPGDIARSEDVPDDEQQSRIDVLFVPWGCYAHLNPTCDSDEWEGSSMHYYYTYQPTNPVCGYAGKFEFKLTNTCAGGGGGGDGNEPTYNLTVDGEATDTLVIHEQNTPEEDGPFVVCVDGDLVVESALERNAGTTTTVPSIWTVNGQADARDNGTPPPETFETFHIPDDFPAAFLDADGKPIPDTYNLTATYECPVTSTTLTAATEVYILEVDTQIKYYEYISGNQIWADEVETVAGDKISFRLVAPAFAVSQFAWDFNDYSNDDATDADQDGIDEKDDDTDNSASFTPTFSYNIPPLSHGNVLYEVNCNVENTGGSVCNATVHVKVNEVLVASGPDDDSWWEGYIQDSAMLVMAHFDDMGYRTDYKHEPPWGTFDQEVLPYYNVLYVCGHGPDSASWGDSDVDVAGLTLDDCDGYRKLQRTTEGTFRKYRFVHFDACHSASNDWLTKYKTALDAESIVGWRGKVLFQHARAFDYYFYSYLKNGASTYNATHWANSSTLGWGTIDNAAAKCLGNVIIKK